MCAQKGERGRGEKGKEGERRREGRGGGRKEVRRICTKVNNNNNIYLKSNIQQVQ